MSADPNQTIPRLADEQKLHFDTQGFLILRGLFSEEEKRDLISWTKEVKGWPNAPNTYMHYEEADKNGRRFLCRTENYANAHKGFGDLLRGSRLTEMLAQISGEPMVLLKEKINYKIPGGGAFDAHTDSPAYRHMGAQKHLTILMAVEPMTTENGCLDVIPGSHLMDIPVRADKCVDDDWSARQTWVPVELDTGDMLIFGGNLAHRSGPNLSFVGRAAIYATYNAFSEGGDQHDVYYVHRRQLWPPTFERQPGEKYQAGLELYAWGTPMTTITAGGS